MGEWKRWILNQGYWIMPNKVLFDKRLKDKQKLLFCLISSLCAEKWYCRASNKYLGEMLCSAERTISDHISDLIELWYIETEIKNWNQRQIRLSDSDSENLLPPSENLLPSDSEKLLHNITTTNTTTSKENKKEKFLEFVYLTNEEYNKLIDTYGERATKEQIRNLNNYIWQKGKDKYKSHYYTILTWNRKAWIKELPKKQENESWIYDLPF